MLSVIMVNVVMLSVVAPLVGLDFEISSIARVAQSNPARYNISSTRHFTNAPKS